ncbi:MAG: M48 family metalloprotease [Acidobacteriota bacterium]
MPTKDDRVWPCLLVLSLVVWWSPALEAQTKLKPGFNIFSPEQDVEIGRRSAAEVEKQLPVLRDSEVRNYVSRIGERLAEVAPGPKFAYQFKVVNVSDINAFALPGGFMYINRGLMEAARDEGELAGVMAHEMSHVALRHGTNQASKAYLGQAGLGILGGVLGSGTTSDIMSAIGGFGMNSLFLKFSRSAEEQADVSAAQMLAKAGYDPMAMARMFETLRENAGRDPSKLEQFFSSHPAPAQRAERIQKETQLIGGYEARSPVGDFRRIQSRLGRMAKAQSMEQLAGNQPADRGRGPREEDSGPVRVTVDRPSSRMRTFEQRDGAFRVRFPANWEAREARSGEGVTLTPEGAVVSRRGEEAIVYGAIINTFDPRANDSRARSTRRVSLEDATERLLAQILASNDYLRRDHDAFRRVSIDGARGLTVSLSGRSPVTEQQERVVLVTRRLDADSDRLVYLLFISPERDYDDFQPVFDNIASSFRVGG